MLSEKDGVALLTAAFRDRGYAIVNNVVFDEDGVVFDIDGWDAASRVGFEYRTSEADDKHDLGDDELALLGGRIERGELTLFIIDDNRIEDDKALADYAARFLDLIAERAPPKKTKTMTETTTKTTTKTAKKTAQKAEKKR